MLRSFRLENLFLRNLVDVIEEGKRGIIEKRVRGKGVEKEQAVQDPR